MLKITLISTLILSVFLTACGQKGELYLPKNTTSEMPTQATESPNGLTNDQNSSPLTPAINPNSQNPNIKIQDTKHDY